MELTWSLLQHPPPSFPPITGEAPPPRPRGTLEGHAVVLLVGNDHVQHALLHCCGHLRPQYLLRAPRIDAVLQDHVG